jgi:hypothetical protein
MQYKKPQQKNGKKVLLLPLLILLLGGIVFGLEKSGVINLYSRDEASNSNTPNPVNTVNYDPPTEEEKNAGDEQKEEIVSEENTQNQKPDSAEVIIVDASQYGDEIEVRAFVANVIESGTCTFWFHKLNIEITKTTPAYADASTTPCITLTIPRSEFPEAGDWGLTVSFESASVKGFKSQDVVTIK